MVLDPRVSSLPFAPIAAAVFQIVLMLAPIALIPWLILGRGMPSLRLVSLALILLGITELACYRFIGGAGASLELIQIVSLVQLGAGLSIFISTLVLRWCGFRMV